jgi:hypothetical protein
MPGETVFERCEQSLEMKFAWPNGEVLLKSDDSDGDDLPDGPVQIKSFFGWNSTLLTSLDTAVFSTTKSCPATTIHTMKEYEFVSLSVVHIF